MKHIDVYMLSTAGKRFFNLEDHEICTIINRRNILPAPNTVKPFNLKAFLSSHLPSTTQQVHALRDLGFQTKAIADYLQISMASASYHLKKDYKEYTSPYWKAVMETPQKHVDDNNLFM